MSNLFLTMVNSVGDLTDGFCANSANIFQVLGWALFIFKIVIPVLLIVWGMLDLGRAVVASKDDEIKKAMKSLAFRAISAIVVFFIPTIIGLVMGLISNFSKSGAQEDYEICRACIVSPRTSNCTHYADSANGDLSLENK